MLNRNPSNSGILSRYYNPPASGPFGTRTRSEPLQPGEGSSSIEPVNPFRNYKGIVQPIAKNQAPRPLNSTTLARDILFALGQHPTEPGLNAHLEVLKAQYTYVNDSSDLATFRWDLVDPPPIIDLTGLPPDRHSTSSENFRNSDVDMAHFPKILSPNQKVDNGQSYPRPITGPIRPPPQPASDSYGNHGHPMYVSRKSGRGGISSAGYVPQQSNLLRDTTIPATKSSMVSVVLSPPLPSGSIHRHPPFGEGIGSRGPVSAVPGPQSTIRFGQPPKLFADTGLPDQRPSDTPKKRGHPFKIVQDASAGTSGTKKRGRPFNTERKTARFDSPSSILIPKKRGRPFKMPHDLVYLSPPNPVFRPFMCEWKDCPAELQDLDTFKTHIFNVHIKQLPRDVLKCLWRKCEKGKDHEFTSRKWLQKHVEEAHLLHVAWHMGDGPKGTSLGT